MKHVTYEILTDDTPLNPRDEFDNLSTFYGPKNSHWLVGGKHDREVYELDELIHEFRKEKAVIVEFESNAGTCYAVVERGQLDKEYLQHGYSMRKALYWARRCAEGEIQTWLAYCNGEVYGYKITDNETGEELDSCWGFYGYDDCEEEAKSQAKWHDEQKEKELAKLDERIVLAATLD